MIGKYMRIIAECHVYSSDSEIKEIGMDGMIVDLTEPVGYASGLI